LIERLLEITSAMAYQSICNEFAIQASKWVWTNLLSANWTWASSIRSARRRHYLLVFHWQPRWIWTRVAETV